MRGIKLRRKILFSFLTIIALLSLLTSAFGFYITKKYMMGRVQAQANSDLKTIRTMVSQQLEKMKISFILAPPDADSNGFKEMTGLDYLYRVQSPAEVRSEIVRRAFGAPATVGGYRRLDKDELLRMGEGFYKRAAIEIRHTPQARSTEKTVLESALSMEYARSFADASGKVTEVLYGGKIINRDMPFIDGIAGTIFENKLYQGKPTGAVTVFLDDVRIATNVLDERGNRAIGTCVSEIVYNKVIRAGNLWLDRAFVVTDWYLTAYEPIRDIEGNIIGILSLGILEKPFTHMQVKWTLAFVGIVSVASLIAILCSFILSDSLARPLTLMLQALRKISEGDWGSRLKVRTTTKEVNELVESVNDMAEKLSQREQRLEVSNEKLAALNKTYLDLIGFVSHELKGIIAAAVINVYTLRDEGLGSINLKQKEVLAALAKSLDYLSAMVRNFLGLSQIEKGEMAVNKVDLFLKEHMIDAAVETFSKLAAEKKVQIFNKVQPQIRVRGDEDLLKIAASNLVSNAVKYCGENGTIILTSRDKGDTVTVEFYNDGTPISDQDKEKLFKRFSRIPNGSGKVKGTGLGLFITKEIIEAHGGRIWVETRPFGNLFAFTIEKSMK